MAIRIATISATDLRPASNITKRNYATAMTVGGTAGKVVGWWQAAFVRLPGSPNFINNTVYPLWGHDGNNAGNFNGGQDGVVWIGGDSASQGALRLRPRRTARSGNQNGYAAANQDFTSVSALTANGTDVYLLVYGEQNTGTDASPVWQGWAARVLVGGGVSSQVIATALASLYVTSATGVLLSQIFNSRPAAGAARSPVNLAFENFAHVNGDFPWDTANNRPHHDALLALANGTGAPATLHSYASLIAAQNAGTLGYANLRGDARADLSFHWTLANLTTGLANSGNGGANALSPANWNSLTGGLEDVAGFTPAHWTTNPTITEPVVKFHGGRGALPYTASGTYQAGTTALQRRWVLAGTSAPVPGFDWAAVGTFGGGTWSTTDTLPFGVFDLQVRDPNDVSRAATMSDFLVGTIALMHGQSGMAGVTENANAPKNVLNIALSAGVQGLYLEGSSSDAGGASYIKPTPLITRMVGGQTPAGLAHGALLMINEWQVHNPGHPLLIAKLAIGGTAMADWAANGTIGQWTYLGTVGEPGTANAGGVGRVGHYAWMLRGIADVHAIMWTPGMSSVEATRTAYADAIDARFTVTPAAPWLVLPPWRGHRSSPDSSSTVAKRAEHVSFVAERGARGILGPYWPDIVMDGNPIPASTANPGSLHCAFHSNATLGGSGSSVSDQNQVGQARLGRGIGRSLAWAYNRTIKAHGPRVVAAWFRDGARTVIEIEMGRAVRTLNGAGINNQFWISTDDGATFAKTGFTVALDASATRAVLTSTGGAWPASNVRVDYARAWPFGPADGDLDEALTERKLDGLLYDDQVHRGGTNLAALPGNPLTSANGNGVAVTARGTAKLLATERWTGTRNVTVRMIAADGVTVLREKTLVITGI